MIFIKSKRAIKKAGKKPTSKHTAQMLITLIYVILAFAQGLKKNLQETTEQRHTHKNIQ